MSAWRKVTYLVRGCVHRIEALSHTRSTVLGQIHHCLHTGQLYDQRKVWPRSPILSAACPKFDFGLLGR
jgi:hypothetical protein